MPDNLQTIVDEMRVELYRCHGGFWCIRSERLRVPLYIEVVPDGMTWLVMATCGDWRLSDRDWVPVDPKTFVNHLYVFIRRLLKEAVSPSQPAKLS